MVTKRLYNIIFSSKHKQNPEKNHQIRTNEGEIAIGEIAIGVIVIGADGASRSRRRRDASIAIAINTFARSRSLRSTHCDRRRDASIAIAIDAFARSRSLRSAHCDRQRDASIAIDASRSREDRSGDRDRSSGWLDRSELSHLISLVGFDLVHWLDLVRWLDLFRT